MTKQMNCIDCWVEVAPSPLISPHKAPPYAPKLKTIAEEGSEKIAAYVNVKALYIIPVILSLASYLFINRFSIIW